MRKFLVCKSLALGKTLLPLSTEAHIGSKHMHLGALQLAGQGLHVWAIRQLARASTTKNTK